MTSSTDLKNPESSSPETYSFSSLSCVKQSFPTNSDKRSVALQCIDHPTKSLQQSFAFVTYNKFLSSEANTMNIQPIEPNKIFYYYIGVFELIKNSGTSQEELIEKIRAPSGSRVEDYFPLLVHCFNSRGNWKCLNTYDAKKIHHIDFVWSNASKIIHKGSIHSRILLNSLSHYISNKRSFYQKFKDYDFIPKFHPINKTNIKETLDEISNEFSSKSIIVKPDFGSVSRGILIQNKFDKEEVISHIKNSSFEEWTISEIFKPKLINGYITSCRIYFLVTKINNSVVNGYLYNHFMIYRCDDKFTGDITDPRQFLTNYMDPNDPLADEKFVRNRYIPLTEWKKNFTLDQIETISKKLVESFQIICDTMKNDIMCFNDNKNNQGKFGNTFLAGSDTIGFHIYGADVLVDDMGNIKIIEINGAPAVNVKTRYYGLKDRLDYFDLIEELFQIVVDPFCPPKNEPKKLDNFIKIYQGSIQNHIKPLFYIPQSITEKYPFILYALEKRSSIKRTKNLHDNIHFFYGLRERYVTDETNMNYYDEILNYLTSKRMKNAKIINKVQGITYYFANKGRLYEKLLERFGERVHKFHPASTIFFFDGDKKKIKRQLKRLLFKNDHIDNWIVKPVHGSRGLGIKIFKKDSSNWLFGFKNNKKTKVLINDIVEYIKYYSNEGFKTIDFTDRAFNGLQFERCKYSKYKYWMVCQYINDPHLIKIPGDTFGRKYNIRFFVLVTMDKLPTYKDIEDYEQCSINDQISVYMFNDFMLYYAMLEYNATELPLQFQSLDKDKYLDKMKQLTNLEIINNSFDELNNLNIKYFDKVEEKKRLTDILSNLYSSESRIFKTVYSQAKRMVINTLDAVKYDLRPLNRFTDGYKGCFNLIAYDSMLDSNGNLWFIEANRGPDMNGLYLNLGMDKCVQFFDEIFKIVLDPHIEECNSVDNDIKLWDKIPLKYRAINNKQKRGFKKLKHS